MLTPASWSSSTQSIALHVMDALLPLRCSAGRHQPVSIATLGQRLGPVALRKRALPGMESPASSLLYIETSQINLDIVGYNYSQLD